MFVTVKGKFLEVDTRNKTDGTIVDYVKIWSEDDIVPVKLPTEWEETPYSSLLALAMGEEVSIDVRLSLFNEKLYFTAVTM